jgi:adenine-specific DNA-methyltransferase
MNLLLNFHPLSDELPSNYADRLGISYTSIVTNEHKKENGQFFTPTPIARLMSSFCNNQEEEIKILDPGSGIGILTCSLIEHLVSKNKNLQYIHLVAYETDVHLVSFLEKSLSYLRQWLLQQNISLTYVLCIDDFALANSKYIAANNESKDTFDIIISNPPYFKLSKDDERAKAAKIIASGQANIYSVFMAIATQLLTDNGELIFITPRSFASGNYFKTFREFFFQAVAIEKIHLFVSRRDTFNRDSVLQETIIMKGRKKGIPNIQFNQIAVSSSLGLKDIQNPTIKLYRSDELIDFSTKEKMLHLPTNEEEEFVINLFKSWSGSLHKYNIQISTGPVVSFRALNFIHDQFQNGTTFLAPLFWLHNVDKMSLNWPIQKPNKGQYIKITDESKSILLPNKDYILLRRFSTKDDKSRLIATPFFSSTTKSDYIGVENKVNYIYRPKGVLEKNEVIGLCALLNSNLFDMYFRTFNGNVNVSATELREITLPPLETIKALGEQIINTNDYSLVSLNNLVNEIFDINHILAA